MKTDKRKYPAIAALLLMVGASLALGACENPNVSDAEKERLEQQQLRDAYRDYRNQ